MTELERAKLRKERLTLLEEMFIAAKEVFRTAQIGGHESWYALAKLKKIIEKIDQHSQKRKDFDGPEAS